MTGTKMKDWTLTAFTEETASKAPSPGGGGVAALTGALAAALAEMVASLTVGKEKYAASEEEMRSILEEGGALRRQLLDAIERDSTSFRSYMSALSLPKETEEEKRVRREALQEGLKEAAKAPMEAAEAAFRVFPLAELAVKKGYEGAVSDGLISAMLARTAVLSALLNVRINLGMIRDEAYTASVGERAKRLEREAVSYEARILALSGLSRHLTEE